MKALSTLACVVLLNLSFAHADSERDYSATQGKLTVVNGFSISTTRESHRTTDSMTLRPGTYEFELASGSFHKSTLCDLLPYCTERWEKDFSFYTEFSLLKKETHAHFQSRKAVKTVRFHSKFGKQDSAVGGILPRVAIGQNLKVYEKSNTEEKLVNERSGKVECMIKSKCWDAYGYDCAYVAGTQPATFYDRITTTTTKARITTLNGKTLANYEAVETRKEEDVYDAKGKCVPNVE